MGKKSHLPPAVSKAQVGRNAVRVDLLHQVDTAIYLVVFICSVIIPSDDTYQIRAFHVLHATQAAFQANQTSCTPLQQTFLQCRS